MVVTWTRINLDDEARLSARERGHTYGEGDTIVGQFRNFDDDSQDDDRGQHVVRLERSPGSGTAFYDADEDPMPVQWTMTAWRYATTEEIEAFEERRERTLTPPAETEQE